MRRALFILLFLLIAQPGQAAAGYYSLITTDHTKVAATDTNFAFLINTTDNRFRTVGNGGHVLDAEGDDLRPYADSACSSALTYKKVNYTASSGLIVMYVLVASLSSSVDNTFYLCYGDSTQTTDGSSSSAFNTSIKAHYSYGDGTTLAVTDASQSGINGTNHSVTASAGQVGGAATFVGASSQYIDLGSGATLNITGVGTWAFWLKLNSNYTDPQEVIGTYLQMGGCGFTDCTNWSVEFGRTDNKFTFLQNAGTVATASTTSISDNNWRFIALVRSGSTGAWTNTYYVNGAADGAPATAQNPDGGNNYPISIGRTGDLNNAGTYLTGSLDETRIYNVALTANQITTLYNNQNPSGASYTVAAETALTVVPLFTSHKLLNVRRRAIL